jgi:hypothetical protein
MDARPPLMDCRSNVLKAIDNLECDSEFGRRNFAPSSYTNSQNKVQRKLVMTRPWVNRMLRVNPAKDGRKRKRPTHCCIGPEAIHYEWRRLER